MSLSILLVSHYFFVSKLFVGMRNILLLTALAAFATASREAIFWVVPYANITSVSGYESAWAQFGSLETTFPGAITLAGSAYALKPNGSLGYASTAAGEGLYGDIMEDYGFAAMRSIGVRPVAMVYVTHSAAIAKMLANPQPFIDELLAKARSQELAGYDIDYEPQGEVEGATAESFMAFLASLSSQMAAAGLTFLSIDIGGCPSFNSFTCAGLANASAIPLLHAVNTMDSFGASGPSSLQALVPVDGAALGARWAPGFEPNNMGQANFEATMAFLASPAACAAPGQCPRSISSWQVHEDNVGPQPQWLFDAVATFLAAK